MIQVKILIDAGVELEVKDNEGKAALHWATEIGAKDIIDLLAPVVDINTKGIALIGFAIPSLRHLQCHCD